MSETEEGEHRIDYRLRRGRVGGMTVEIAPGPGDVVSLQYWHTVDQSSSLSIDERAFEIVEQFLLPAWGSANNYSRYGVSAIPAAIWTEVLDELERYRDLLSSAAPIVDARLDRDSIVEVYEDLAVNFGERRPLAVAFLDDLVTTTRPWTQSWSSVFFFGV